MKNKNKTKEQLIDELAILRQHISKLEKLETERKQAEEALHKSEKRYRILFESANDAIFIMNGDRFIECNLMALSMFGCNSKSDIIGHSPIDFSPEKQPDARDSKEKALEYITSALEGMPQRFYWKHIRRDGTPFDVEVSLSCLVFGDDTHLQAIVRDITERKSAEEELRTSEEKFYKAFRNNPDSLYITTIPEGKFVDVNPAFEKISGYNKDEVLGKTALELDFYISPDDRDKLFQQLQKDGKLHDYEISFRIKSGEIRLCRVFSEVLEIQGKPHLLSIVRDITEQKKAEMALRESEERLTSFMNSAEDSFYLLDSELNFVEINKKALEIIGKKREKIIGKNITEIVPDVKESGRYDKHLEVIGTGKPFVIDYFVPHLIFGNLHFILKSFKVGDGLGVIATDITKRKEAEEALHLSEEKFSKAFQASPHSMAVIDLEERRRIDVNEAFTQITGYSCEEAVGKTFSEVDIHVDLKRFEKGIKHLKKNGFIRGYELKIRTKAGEERILSHSGEIFEVAGKKFAIIAGEDITDRKHVEEEILNYQKNLRSLALKLSLTEEQERRNIATYVHDQIGQKLALAKMKLGILDESLLAAVHHKPAREIRNLIEETIQDTRNLTFELSPPILYVLGIEQSIEWLVEQFREKHELQFEFSDDGKSKPLDDDIRVILFQAVRELLMNVVKHSKAKTAKISVCRERGEILVRIYDNGVGFDTSMLQLFSIKIGRFGLFNIRERLQDFDGHLDIKSKVGQGTQVTLKAPLRLEEKALKKKR